MMGWRRIGRQSASDQRGQVLPLFAISAVVILALMGLGLDGARIFLERREAQSAADLAALSAARLLPGDAAGARAQAIEIAAANGFTITNANITTPYHGDAGKIRVEIPSNVSMLFTAVIGIADTPVTASAAAMREEEVVGGTSEPLAGPAVLAYDNICDQNDTLKWDAHDTVINGDVISNSGGDINGSNNVMNGSETWYTTGACSSQLFIDPAQNPQPQFEAVEDLVGYPLDHTAPPFSNLLSGGLCDVSAMGALGITVYLMGTDEVPYASGTQMAEGIYCRVDNAALPTTVKEKINIKTAGSSCTGCTFVSDLVQASAANIAMDPYVAVATDGTVCLVSNNTCNGYPLFTYAPPSDPKDGINFSGSGQQWDGVMFSPVGTTHYSGHDAQVYDGAIWSRVVQIIGSGFQLNGPSEWGIVGPGGPAQPEFLGLIE